MRTLICLIVGAFVLNLGCTATFQQDAAEHPSSGDGEEWSDERTMASFENWKAEDFFSGDDEVGLALAVEKGEVAAIDEAAKAGRDLNVRGKEGMTLLMWSFATRRRDCFEKLLQLRADPNLPMQILLKSKERKRSFPRQGDCVTIVVVAEAPLSWVKVVLDNGGDVNVMNEAEKMSVLGAACCRGRFIEEAVAMVLDRKPENLDHPNKYGHTAAMALTFRTEWAAAARVIEAGASTECYNNSDEQLIDMVAFDRRSMFRQFEDDPEGKKAWEASKHSAGFEHLVAVLEKRGCDIESAILSLTRGDEMINGVPYYKWRREQRGHEEVRCPESQNTIDQDAK